MIHSFRLCKVLQQSTVIHYEFKEKRGANKGFKPKPMGFYPTTPTAMPAVKEIYQFETRLLMIYFMIRGDQEI